MVRSETHVTQEFLEQMKVELEELKSVTRMKVAERLKEAIALGDLSENSEYEDAKNQQAFVEGKIQELEEKIRTAHIIETAADGAVSLGSVVTIVSLATKEESVYTIVGSAEADPFNGKLSNESPVGKALIGKKKGNKVSVYAPEQVLEYKIKKIQ